MTKYANSKTNTKSVNYRSNTVTTTANYGDVKDASKDPAAVIKNNEQSQVDRKPAKPLIKPASKTPPTPKIKSKPVAKKIEPKRKFDWDGILDRTFLSLFMQKKDPMVGMGRYDYAFHIGRQRIYVVVHAESMEASNLKVHQKKIAKLKQRAATKLTKRFQQLRQRLDLPHVDGNDITSVFCIGLTSLSVYVDNQEYPIDHEYNSLFFQEECVLDLDDDGQTLQLFSLGGLIKIMKLLQTPSDLLTFLDFHRPILINQHTFTNEVKLAQTFLTSPEFYERAIEVQKQLVKIGLLANVEDRLINATKASGNTKLLDKKASTEDSLKQEELIEKLQNYAQMYQKLINGLAKRRHEQGDTLPVEHIQLLIDESMYTRMSIIEEVVAYADRSEAECRNGYLCHQHSYNHFGHHYVLIVYGIDDDAQYSRESVQHNFENLLMDINSQLQNPVMREYFILGFDMSKHDGEGNITVEVDAYHQPGSTMSAMEKRLYDQVQALSNL